MSQAQSSEDLSLVTVHIKGPSSLKRRTAPPLAQFALSVPTSSTLQTVCAEACQRFIDQDELHAGFSVGSVQDEKGNEYDLGVQISLVSRRTLCIIQAFPGSNTARVSASHQVRRSKSLAAASPPEPRRAPVPDSQVSQRYMI